MGWSIVRGKLLPCQACAADKARQRAVPQVPTHETSNVVNERIYLDIAVIKGKEDMKVTNPNWLIKVDEKRKLKFTSFHPSMSGIVEPSCEHQ